MGRPIHLLTQSLNGLTHWSGTHITLEEFQNGQLNVPVYHHLIGLTMFNFLHIMGIQLCSQNKRKEIGGTVRRKSKKKPFMSNPAEHLIRAARGDFWYV